MSEVVEHLIRLLRIPTIAKRSAGDGIEADPFERSFCSAHTKFIDSPEMNYFSV